MPGLADFAYRPRPPGPGLADIDLSAFASRPAPGSVLARLQPDPNEPVEWTGTVTMPRWMRDKLARGEVVWTDFRQTWP